MRFKVCGSCKEQKALTEFFKRADRDGFRSKCKSCFQQDVNARRTDPQIKAKRASHMREYRKNNREAWLKASIKYRYNITLDEWNQMFDAQIGKCAICEKEFSGTPHVDHCHITGQIRGLLCGACNRMLGQAKDNPNVLLKGAAYLAIFR